MDPKAPPPFPREPLDRFPMVRMRSFKNTKRTDERGDSEVFDAFDMARAIYGDTSSFSEKFEKFLQMTDPGWQSLNAPEKGQVSRRLKVKCTSAQLSLFSALPGNAGCVHLNGLQCWGEPDWGGGREYYVFSFEESGIPCRNRLVTVIAEVNGSPVLLFLVRVFSALNQRFLTSINNQESARWLNHLHPGRPCYPWAVVASIELDHPALSPEKRSTERQPESLSLYVTTFSQS